MDEFFQRLRTFFGRKEQQGVQDPLDFTRLASEVEASPLAPMSAPPAYDMGTPRPTVPTVPQADVVRTQPVVPERVTPTIRGETYADRVLEDSRDYAARSGLDSPLQDLNLGARRDTFLGRVLPQSEDTKARLETAEYLRREGVVGNNLPARMAGGVGMGIPEFAATGAVMRSVPGVARIFDGTKKSRPMLGGLAEGVAEDLPSSLALAAVDDEWSVGNALATAPLGGAVNVVAPAARAAGRKVKDVAEEVAPRLPSLPEVAPGLANETGGVPASVAREIVQAGVVGTAATQLGDEPDEQLLAGVTAAGALSKPGRAAIGSLSRAIGERSNVALPASQAALAALAGSQAVTAEDERSFAGWGALALTGAALAGNSSGVLKPLDRAGERVWQRMIADPSDKMVSWIAERKPELAHFFFTEKSLPDGYRDLRDALSHERAAAGRQATQLSERIASYGEQFDQLLSTAVDEGLDEASFAARLAGEGVEGDASVISEIHDVFSGFGDTMVAQGLLTPESYAKYKNQYLPLLRRGNEVETRAGSTRSKKFQTEAMNRLKRRGPDSDRKPPKINSAAVRSAVGIVQESHLTATENFFRGVRNNDDWTHAGARGIQDEIRDIDTALAAARASRKQAQSLLNRQKGRIAGQRAGKAVERLNETAFDLRESVDVTARALRAAAEKTPALKAAADRIDLARNDLTDTRTYMRELRKSLKEVSDFVRRNESKGRKPSSWVDAKDLRDQLRRELKTLQGIESGPAAQLRRQQSVATTPAANRRARAIDSAVGLGREQVRDAQVGARRLERGVEKLSVQHRVSGRLRGDLDARNSEVADLFARKKELEEALSTKAAEAEAAGFVQLPTDKKLGSLSGAWVDPLIAQDIKVMNNMTLLSGKIMDGYLKGLRVWKKGKTVYNPGTHGRNVVSAQLLSWMGDGPVPFGSSFQTAWRQVRDKSGEWYDRAFKQGIFDSDFISQEIDTLGRARKAKLTEDPGEVAAIMAGREAGPRGAPGEIDRKVTQLYKDEDHSARLSHFIDAVKRRGMSDEEAAQSALEWVPDFSDLSESSKWVSKLGAPFFAYTAVALPRVAKASVTRPVRFMALGSIAYALEKLMFSEDSDDTVLPHEMRGALKGDGLIPQLVNFASPTMVPLGEEERDGSKRQTYLDLTYVMPYGDIAEGRSSKTGPLDGIPNQFSPAANPLFNLGSELKSNQSHFTGRPITDGSMDAGERRFATTDHIYKALTPSLAPPVPGISEGGFGFQKLRDAIVGRPNSRGEVRSMGSAVSDVILGMKQRQIDPETEAGWRIYEFERQLQALDRKANRIARDPRIPDEEKDRLLDDITTRSQRVVDQIRNVGSGR